VSDLLAERLLQVIDEGRRTATYKLALLLAIFDRVAIDPDQPLIPTRHIAQEVLGRYYPQSRLYVTSSGGQRDLQQITMKSSKVLTAVLRLRVLGDNAGCRTAQDCASVLPADYAAALSVVEDTFVQYPIPLLQVVNGVVVPFLYEAPWPQGTRLTSLRAQGRDTIALLAGVGPRLVALGPLVRPLIELHWARDVARWSEINLEDEALHRHLFAAVRVNFPRSMRSDLADLQGGACFYCGARLRSVLDVDHFLAWSRWPNDAIENLVVADRCNGRKSDHLAASAHLARWAERFAQERGELAGIAQRARWRSDPGRSWGLVHSTYSLLPQGTPLWVLEDRFELADDRIRDALGS
jgi:hypothetical protein